MAVEIVNRPARQVASLYNWNPGDHLASFSTKIVKMLSVLFVCTANICRSPMAMGLWQAKVGSSAANWRIESAGTWAPEGEQPAAKTLMILKERGIDLQSHHSRIVTEEMLHSFNLILTMEQGHKEAIRAEFPEIADRVYLLTEMIGKHYDINDPIGGSLIDFQDTAQEIDRILTAGFEKICELAEK